MASQVLVDYERFWSQRAKDLPPNPFVGLLPLMRDPSTKVLCQGVPPDTTFPLQTVGFTLADGTSVTLTVEETRLAQRYPAFAWGPLREWLLKHINHIHSPSVGLDWDVAIAAGSMSSVDLVCAAFIDRGDIVLVESYSFMASLDAFRSYGARLEPIALDSEGLLPDALEKTCLRLQSNFQKAKLLYTIPVGQNPTGSTLALERYKQIYELARRFNLLIVEDDAYFYQQHTSRNLDMETDRDHVSKRQKVTCEQVDASLPGLQLGRTFLSIDTDGRVFRLDSFSKCLAPGFRLGWVSGARPLISKYNALAYASSQNGCSLSMMLLGKMLEAWGDDGLEKHLLKLQLELRDGCNALIKAAEEHLGSVATWTRPKAGMFLWVEMKQAPRDREQLLQLMQNNGIAVLPGEYCAASIDSEQRCSFIRLSFVLQDEHYPEAMKRLAKLVSHVACD
mmetsp:Transcript_68627/g.108255  ORF Transcript_68627/g.108255 Transcript_68627/m.108255 type:complete len:450 (+) Transcript_68627:106-1455(+)